MISREQHAHIRRLFFAEHWKVGTIATELGLHPDTVARAIEIERFGSRVEGERPSTLDPYEPFVLATLDKPPRLRSTRLLEMLRVQRPNAASLRASRAPAREP